MVVVEGAEVVVACALLAAGAVVLAATLWGEFWPGRPNNVIPMAANATQMAAAARTTPTTDLPPPRLFVFFFD